MWRYLLTPAASGAENMALDQALMDRARDAGEWVLRVYAWSKPTISLGRNQTAAGRYDVRRMAERGLDVVRRPTGGRAILHHREITYSVTAPTDHAGDLGASYARINRILVSAMQALGVAAELAASSSRTMAPGMTPCFDSPSAGELVVSGRKLAGSAQWRAGGALLQHGSILVEDDQSALAEFTIGGGPSVPAPATLSTILGRGISIQEVGSALADAVTDCEGAAPAPLSLEEPVRARTAALVVRYLDDAWTWRR